MTGAVITGPWPRSGRRTKGRPPLPPHAVAEPSDDDLLRLGRALHGFVRANDWHAIGALLGGLAGRERVRRRPHLFEVPLLADTFGAAAD